MSSSIGTMPGSPSSIRASIIPNTVLGAPGGVRHQPLQAVVGGRLADREEDPAQLLVAPTQVAREAVVTLDEPRQLVVAGDLDSDRVVAGRCSLDGLPHGPQRRGEAAGQEVGEEDGNDDRRREHEQHDAANVGSSPARARDLGDDEHEPEDGERQDRAGDQARREARPEREPHPDRCGSPGARPRPLPALDGSPAGGAHVAASGGPAGTRR